MATSFYEYTSTDSLAHIADLFNTDIVNLVRLNSWLKDPVDGHTYKYPSRAIVKQTISKNDNNLYSLAVVPIQKTLTGVYIGTEGANIDVAETSITTTQVGNKQHVIGKITQSDDTSKEVATIDYTNSASLQFSGNYGAILSTMTVTYKPSTIQNYVVVPLIANGNIAIEDYWDTVDSIVGLNYNILYDDESVSDSYPDSSMDMISSTNSMVDVTTQTFEFVNANFDESNLSYEYENTDYKKVNIGKILQNAIESSTTGYGVWQDKNKMTSISGKGRIKATGGWNTLYGTSLDYTDISDSLTRLGGIKTIIKVGTTTLTLPIFPDSIEDGTSANYSPQEIMGRSQPYMVYYNTDARKISFKFTLHRDMFSAWAGATSTEISKGEEKVENIINTILSGVYPSYSDNNVAPLRTTVTVGKQLYITGIMLDNSVSYSGPIGKDGKYDVIDITFSVQEVLKSPYSASQIANKGSVRK